MRNVILAGCGVCLFVWLLIITYLYDSDPCKGKVYTAYLVRLQSTCTLKLSVNVHERITEKLIIK